MVSVQHCLTVLLVCCSCVVFAAAQALDSDGDGLSDYQETNKYLTDPTKADTDGDGVPDADWDERREYQYTVRSRVQVMRPVTVEYLNDDYQDAKVRKEAKDYVELEVVHYPFNRNASTVVADRDWRATIKQRELKLSKWLEPGPTSDHDSALSEEIVTALAEDGIDLGGMHDKQIVEAVSEWLLQRAEYQDGFSCFATAFDENGMPYIPEDTKDDVGKDDQWTFEEQWEREISAAGMFRHRMRGSCSSSAIYLSGCLRAVGIPTRTVLCIPLVDANDDKELAMVRALKQPFVRDKLIRALEPLQGKWASHTFNEVFVGGRWRRLNYARLGQNSFDPHGMGLMTHVATFHDWADAKMSETIGRRHMPGVGDHFDTPNPYSTIAIRDEVGAHCEVQLPKKASGVTVDRILWTDSSDLPEDVREGCRSKGRFGLIAEVTGLGGMNEALEFVKHADMRAFMDATEDNRSKLARQSKPTRLKIGFDPNCFWISNNLLRIYVPFGLGDRRDLVKGVTYQFVPRNEKADFRWEVPLQLTIARSTDDRR